MRCLVFIFGVFVFMNIVSAVIPDDCNPLDEMVAYWQMEEDPSNSTVGDSYGNHDGTWQGARQSELFMINTGAKFSGDDKISIPDLDGKLSLSGNSGFTIEFWVKKTTPPPADYYLLNKGNYKIEWVSSNQIKATVGSATVNSNIINYNVPYHILLTWEPTAGNLSLWVNGDYQSSTSLSRPKPSASQLEIGENFVGLIDEVALYETYFTENQTKDHYDLSSSGKDYCYPGGSGGSSSTRSDFTIDGCSLPGGGVLTAGSCSRDGMYYCGEESLLLYDTLTNYSGCSFERTYYNKGEPQCCPSGYLCNADGDLTCGQRTEECYNITNQNECDNAGCFWLGEEDCVENPLEYSCSIYKSNQSCVEDIWNLGQLGAGTDVCGTYFVVSNQGYVLPQDSCACDWVDNGYEHCVLGYDIFPDIYGGDASSFRCLKDFDVGPCTQGIQTYNWSVAQTNLTGDFLISGIPTEVLEKAKCLDQNGLVRPCGEPIIKSPGFSLFSLFTSVSILALYYFIKEKRNKKRV